MRSSFFSPFSFFFKFDSTFYGACRNFLFISTARSCTFFLSLSLSHTHTHARAIHVYTSAQIGHIARSFVLCFVFNISEIAHNGQTRAMTFDSIRIYNQILYKKKYAQHRPRHVRMIARSIEKIKLSL